MSINTIEKHVTIGEGVDSSDFSINGSSDRSEKGERVFCFLITDCLSGESMGLTEEELRTLLVHADNIIDELKN